MAGTALWVLAPSAWGAATLDVTYVAMSQPAIVNFSDASNTAIDENVEDAPLQLTTSSGATLYAFCVDIWHTMYLGTASPAFVYTAGALTTDSSGALTGTGAALSDLQIQEIGGLANLGHQLIGGTDPTLALDLAGIQAAIWAIENPEVTVTASTMNTPAVQAELNAEIAFYEANAPTSTEFSTFYDVEDNTQGIIIPAPEPGTWGMMLTGFGVVGGAIRAARRRARDLGEAALG